MKRYSERLGLISDEQFQKALDTFNLGKFVKAEPILQGLFGQNVYLTSTKGNFVLRGKPHYDWQFKNEKLFADLLNEKTNVPVPHPYLLDTDINIFGWEYIIMPRMSGKDLSDNLDEDYFTDSDRIRIAKAQGEVLKEAQKLKNDICGKFDLQLNEIKAYEPNWIAEYTKQIFERLEKSAQFNPKTPDEDISWVKDVISQAQESIEGFIPAFYMQDFKPGNMVVDKVNGVWKVTGLFDLMEASFGHPEADISRLYAVYVEGNRDDLAYAFINSHLPAQVSIDKFVKRFPLFMLHDRSIIWEWVQRTDKAWWDKNWTFKQWMKKFLQIDRTRIHH